MALYSSKRDASKSGELTERGAKALRQEELLLQKRDALVQRVATVRAKQREAEERRQEKERQRQEKDRERAAKLEQQSARKAEKERQQKERGERALVGTAPITKFFAAFAKKAAPAAAAPASPGSVAVAGSSTVVSAADAAAAPSAGEGGQEVTGAPSGATPSAAAASPSVPNEAVAAAHLGPQCHTGAVNVDPGSCCRVTLRARAAGTPECLADLSDLLHSGFKSFSGASTSVKRLPVRGGVRGGSWCRVPAVPAGKRWKYIQFHDSLRPPFCGTFSKRPTGDGVRLSGRNPLAQDDSIFNYEVGGLACFCYWVVGPSV